MNKRLTALFLCLVMMLSVFLASCSKDSEEDAKSELEEAKVASNMTLTMWIVSESPVDDDIRNDVSKAINSLTKAKYKTQLEIYYLSEEEYFSKLTAAMEAYAQTKKEQNAGKPAETGSSNEENGTTAEEIVTDENGMYRDNYPIALANQVDIIYIGDVKDQSGKLLMSGQQMYSELRSKDWLVALDEAIKGDAKKIKEFVSPTLLSAVQEKGVTYAIPNNNVIGEYTFMCLNKELMDRYSMQGHLTRGSIKNFSNDYVYQFINMISRYESNLLPVDATYEECLALLAYYWNVNPEDYSIDSDALSVFGTTLFDDQPNRGQNAVGVNSLFENEEFTTHYLALNKYRMDKDTVYFRDEANKNTAYAQYGIKFVKGSLDELTVKDGVSYYIDTKDTSSKDDDVYYYVVPVSYPTAKAEDIYGNMFAVASTTLSVDRSMQIITYLNTNAEIRNLLQYGIKDQHYVVDANGEVTRQKDKNGNYYLMDVYATGNAFLAYPEPGADPAIWENGKKQNRDSLVEPLLGFNLSEFASTATQFGTPVTVTSGKPYSTTFRSGLNKAVLSEDPVLGAWLDSCVEPGVYVFRTREKTINNEFAEILYFYNNTGSYRFGVESEEVTKETGTGYYRNNTYTYTPDSSLNGSYTLTMVYDINLVRYEGQYKVVNRTVDANNVETSRTDVAHKETFQYTESRYDFDLYDTDFYQMNVYGDLTLAHFYENSQIYNELVKLYNEGEKENKDVTQRTKKNYILSWVDTESSDTKDYHSFIVYRQNIKYTTVVDVVPTAQSNGIKLMINYEEHENSELKDGEGDDLTVAKRYSLYYITIETLKGVKVSAATSASKTTVEEIGLSKFTHEFITETIPTTKKTLDPIDFKVCGMLNTELVKYMAQLNSEIVALLENYAANKTYAELEKLVKDIGVMLNTEEVISMQSDAYKNLNGDLKDLFKNWMVNNNFQYFFYQLTHITHYETMDKYSQIGFAASEVKESRVTLYSPFGIYYLWMEAYQYLPADMQPQQ